MRQGSTRRRIAQALAVGALAVGGPGLLAACGAGNDSAAGSDAGGVAADLAVTSEGVPEPAGRKAGLGGPGEGEGQSGQSTGADGAGRVPVQLRKVISTGRVTLEGKDLERVRDDLDRLLGRFGGYVDKESTSKDRKGRTDHSTLTLRVPSQHFDDLMGAFDELATVTDTGREAVDVTTEVIDVDARIRTEEVSLERLRRFLGEARTVEAMIRLESEIARREADLASLRAQQNYLDDQTSLATITVTMQRTGREGPPPEREPDTGFLTGLEGGWKALVEVLLVVATVAGALVPFAVTVGLVGAPVWFWLRAARRRRTPAPGPAEVV